VNVVDSDAASLWSSFWNCLQSTR